MADQVQTYRLRFARLVICETEIKAATRDDADEQAHQLEHDGGLSISPLSTPNERVEIIEVQDYEHIWELERG